MSLTSRTRPERSRSKEGSAHLACLSAAAVPKIRFPGPMGAIDAAHGLARRSGRTVRIYCCPGCGGWHLTTKGPR